MCIVGYEDEKHAFKVLDSRGERWGDEGFIWIDYDLMSDNTVVYDALVCSFDDKILRDQTYGREGEGDPEHPNEEIDTNWVKSGYYRDFGTYRIACADIDKKNETAKILIRDSIGAALTPIITIKLLDTKQIRVNKDVITIQFTKLNRTFGKLPTLGIEYVATRQDE
ncbi:hypothetical protein [Xanthocytophaga flava]|uniref:hypothetical protein n=1 Tax=Xanthocytophaga flava TaxID=3048013 RepID=UPI0028D4CB39|nr:hypothetical protein [Xanthocytophaga flavus]MDJ1470262.1 hypothetical protein [Xanthocytophaga flavus]